MATQLTDASIDHLALVFREKDGVEYAPRNKEARVLGFKAGATEQETLLRKIVKTAKKALGQLPASDVPEQSGSDYDAIAKAIATAFGGLQVAFDTEGDKSSAVKAAIDGLLTELDAIRGVEKAGKRHSAADQAKLDAAEAAHAKLGKAIAAAQKAHGEMGEQLDGLKPAQPAAQDGDDAAKAESVEDEADKANKKPYGDIAYADPENGKYPIDTEEHVRAAWSYINMPKNAAEYSADKLAEVKSKIKAAAKKFDIAISEDDNKAGASATDSNQEVEMNAEEVKAMIAEALAAQKAEADKAAAEKQAEVEAAKAEAEKAQADAEQARKDAEAAKAESEAAKAAQEKAETELNAAARKPSGKGAPAEKSGPSKLALAIKAANSGSVNTAQGGE